MGWGGLGVGWGQIRLKFSLSNPFFFVGLPWASAQGSSHLNPPLNPSVYGDLIRQAMAIRVVPRVTWTKTGKDITIQFNRPRISC